MFTAKKSLLLPTPPVLSLVLPSLRLIFPLLHPPLLPFHTPFLEMYMDLLQGVEDDHDGRLGFELDMHLLHV